MLQVPDPLTEGQENVPLAVTLAAPATKLPVKLQETPEFTSIPNETWPLAETLAVPLPGVLTVRVPPLTLATILPENVLPLTVPVYVPV